METNAEIDNVIDENLEEEFIIFPTTKVKTIKKNVLTLCPIPESINIDKIKEDITNYMTPRKPFYESTQRSPYVEDEFSEYFIAIASSGCEIGRGHCGMDVKTKNNEGIDAMCVIMNKDMSNEKSIIQNFASSGCDLDTLFKEKKDNEAVELYMNDYKQKLENVKDDKNLTDMYILSYISTNIDIYLATSCEGLNLQQYSEVYFTAPHWNPAVESQAVARAHRIGQTKNVEVFKFINVIHNSLSIEKYITGVQYKKLNYANSLFRNETAGG